MNDQYADYFEPGALGAAGLRMAWPFLKPVISRVGGPLTSLLMDTKELNAGEKDLYVKGPDGKYVLNQNNPTVRSTMPNGSPMSPMPASFPFPTMPNGMNPANPSMMQAPGMFPSRGFNPPSAAPSPAAASPAAASASPSPSPGLPPPASSGPQMPAAGGGGFNPPLPPAFSRQMPSFYNGPGSMNFGASEQAPGGGLGGLMALAQGGTKASAAIQGAPNKPLWNAIRAFTNNGQSFAPNWFASNAPYNT